MTKSSNCCATLNNELISPHLSFFKFYTNEIVEHPKKKKETFFDEGQKLEIHVPIMKMFLFLLRDDHSNIKEMRTALKKKIWLCNFKTLFPLMSRTKKNQRQSLLSQGVEPVWKRRKLIWGGRIWREPLSHTKKIVEPGLYNPSKNWISMEFT